MNALGKNITDLARLRGLSIPKLAMRAGVDKGNLSRMIKSGEGYSSSSLSRLADALSVSVERLFASGQNVTTLPAGVRRVPLLDAIHAGIFQDITQYMRDEEMQDFVLTTNQYSPRAFAMRVSGESMIPDFLPGDIIIVDPDEQVKPGRFVIAANGDGEATLKRFADRGLDDKGREVFELISSNHHYPSLLSTRQPLRIIGVVCERIIKLI